MATPQNTGAAAATVPVSALGSTSKDFVPAANEHPLVWVDLEMTGLDTKVHRIIEMACVVTDAQLNILEKGPSVVIHQPSAVMDKMGPYVRDMHARSGLTGRVAESKVDTKTAEDMMLAFIQKHCSAGRSPLCGNSVHQDRRFLETEMPSFLSYLHYRIVDVSTIKELASRWYPKELRGVPPKAGNHLAMDDILESIEELKWYRANLMIKPEYTVPAPKPIVSSATLLATPAPAPAAPVSTPSK